MFEGKNGEIPFGGDLQSTGQKGKYFEVKTTPQDPDLVIKEGKTKWGFFEIKGVHPLNDIDRVCEDLRILQEDFGEFLPETEVMEGKNRKGEDTIYIIQHKIEGIALEKTKGIDQVREELKAFFDSVIEGCKRHLVFYGSAKRPSIIFPDMKGWNFMYGKDAKTKEEKERLYFVDTYPIEGSEFNSEFVQDYIWTVVRPTFPANYWVIIDQFARKLYDELRAYIKDHAGEIPHVGQGTPNTSE